jgi:hypothetical protein
MDGPDPSHKTPGVLTHSPKRAIDGRAIRL